MRAHRQPKINRLGHGDGLRANLRPGGSVGGDVACEGVAGTLQILFKMPNLNLAISKRRVLNRA